MASKQGPGCLILFGLVFVVAGSIPGFLALHALGAARETQGWVETQATLLQVALHQDEGTASVQATYRYRAPDAAALEGGGLRDYEGSRVGIHFGSDNVGDWQMETFARLDAAWKRGEPVPCWYDPAEPGEAVLDRGERWEMVGFLLIFPLVFGLVGGGIALSGWRQWRAARRPRPEPAQLAHQALIPADGGSGCALWVMAIVWNTISWVGLVGVLWKGDGIPWLIVALVALFPLIGLGLLWGALLGTARRLRHGRPRLRLDDGAWMAGGRVRATVLSATPPQDGDRIAARLAVLQRITTSSGKETRTSEKTLWGLDLAIDVQAGRNDGGDWAQTVELPLPSDLPPSAEDVTWRLDWQLIRPGPDLSAAFTLPVVAGDGSGPASAELLAAADRAAPLAVLQRAGITVAEERGEVVVTLPAWRNPGLHLTGLIISALLTLGGIALWQEVGWWTGLFSLPILALCWFGALRSAMWRSTITLAPGRIAVAAGWHRIVRHELKPAEITEVERKTSMSTNDTAWYNMWLRTGDGERIAIVRCVTGPAAERLAEMIEAVRR